MIVIDTPQATRSQRLKAATRDSHGALDKRIMAGDIFASRDLFAKILASEEEHVDWLETQLSLMARLGEGPYLQSTLAKD